MDKNLLTLFYKSIMLFVWQISKFLKILRFTFLAFLERNIDIQSRALFQKYFYGSLRALLEKVYVKMCILYRDGVFWK